MYSISEAVEEIIEQDDIAKESLSQGILNLSAYARKIQSKVADETFKPVNEKSIVVSLSRLQHKYSSSAPTVMPKMQTVMAHSDLEEYSIYKTDENMEKLEKLYGKIDVKTSEFFTVTQSMTEITIIAEPGLMKIIREALDVSRPIFFKRKLTAVSVKFKKTYLQVPNIISSITKSLAVKNINIIEIVSTATELTFIIDKKDTNLAMSQLSKLL